MPRATNCSASSRPRPRRDRARTPTGERRGLDPAPRFPPPAHRRFTVCRDRARARPVENAPRTRPAASGNHRRLRVPPDNPTHYRHSPDDIPDPNGLAPRSASVQAHFSMGLDCVGQLRIVDHGQSLTRESACRRGDSVSPERWSGRSLAWLRVQVEEVVYGSGVEDILRRSLQIDRGRLRSEESSGEPSAGEREGLAPRKKVRG